MGSEDYFLGMALEFRVFTQEHFKKIFIEDLKKDFIGIGIIEKNCSYVS
jgi:hypothetical protein